MEKISLDQWSRLLRYVLLSFAILYIGIYSAVALSRINYPFELEWQEGLSVDHVRRVLSEKKLYGTPSLEFIPYPYTPFYFYLSAAMAKVTGIGYLPLRLVSFVSSLGCFLAIFLIVKRDTGNNFSAALSAGLFAATFQIGGSWFDLARVDSLWLLLLLTALYFIKFGMSPKAHIWGGIFISLSFLTKQTALIISSPIMFYYLFWKRRCAPFFIATIVAAVGISTLLLNYIYDGWYYYYTFGTVRHLYFLLESRYISFWTKDILSPLPVACILSIFYLIFSRLLNSTDKSYLLYFFAAIGMIGGAWFSRLHAGGYNNALFPAYAIISIFFGLAFYKVFELTQAATAYKKRLLQVNLYLVCILQFAYLGYNPFRQIPTLQDLEAGKDFINTMKQINGDILIPNHPYLPVLAGKSSNAHKMIIGDILYGDQGRFRDKLRQEILKGIRGKKFGAIILDSGDWDPFQKDVDQHYTISKHLFPGNDTVFFPVTGFKSRPMHLYIPRKNPPIHRLIDGSRLPR